MHGLLASLGRHKALKLLSLFLAVALWLAVGGEERTETNLNLALELVNLDPELMITSQVPSNIQVQVVGPRGLIRSLSQSRLTQTLDLAGVKAGRRTFPLGVGSFSFPRGIQVTRVQPNPLNLVLTPTITKTLPVQPVFLGRPPEGYEVKSVKTRPGKVTVKGPDSELKNLKFLTTVPLDVTNLTGPITLATDLDFKNLPIRLTGPVTLLADVDIGPKTIRRSYFSIPLIPQPLQAQLSPAKVTLTLLGPWPKFKDLKPNDDLKAFVNTEGLSPGRHRLKVQVQVPPDLTLEKVVPSTITARLPQK